MRKIFILSFLLQFQFSLQSTAQKEQWLRAFPITSYIVDGNDSVKIVQLEMPEQITLKEKQLGLIRGVYESNPKDTAEKGFGRCQLIKSNYYYFAIVNKNGIPLKEGDLLYTLMDKTEIYYGLFPKLAAHFIRLQSVNEQPFYDRYLIFSRWTAEEEKKLMDSVVADIRYTGNYFLENDPSLDKEITSGDYKGKKILSVMAACKQEEVADFFEYIIARPRLYAGRTWKVSEIFATWIDAGAPRVVK
ncbi:MAG TPA: hypothetical protein VFV31_10405 [Chitinophagaceae bacterium]|nr:hypothetical protein [Chitinophagaceae bacterium]